MSAATAGSDLPDPFQIIRDAVMAERAKEGCLKAAYGHVSVAFGITPRRVRGVWQNEPIRLEWREVDRIRAVAKKRLDAKLRFEAETRCLDARQAWVRLSLGGGA